MLKQLEGSQGVAKAVALCRPEVVCAYPISPQTHIVEAPWRALPQGRPQGLRVHQRRERVRGHVRCHRRIGCRRPRLYGHRLPGPALHGRGGLQRVRSRTPDRHDGRQPCDRRTDQHLERPFGLHEPARQRLDPALCGDQSGGRRPAHPGLPHRGGALAARHGLHGRLRAHPRLRAHGHSLPGGRRRVPAAL